MSDKEKIIKFLNKSDEELQVDCDRWYYNGLMPAIARLQIKAHLYASKLEGFNKLDCIKHFIISQNYIRDEMKKLLKNIDWDNLTNV